MATTGDDDVDAVLSDMEGDDPVPIVIKDSSPDEISVERFRELQSQLDRERQDRQAAENSKSELQVSFNRLKVLAHEAIRKRDEITRQKDEAVREKEEALRLKETVSKELEETSRIKDEVLKQRDEIGKELEEAVKARDLLRSEIENSSHMFVTGIEKISGKISNYKNFPPGGLPRSQKYSGLQAIAYGVIKRTNEIVEELVKQIEVTAKSRNEAREQIEQRNFEIAIEVSELESTINQLKDEVLKKTTLVENLEKTLGERDTKISQVESEMSQKLKVAGNEVLELRQLLDEYETKLTSLESKMDSQRPLLIDQLNVLSKIHDQIYDVIKIIDVNKLDQTELSESLFFPQETDMEENIRASLAGMEFIHDLIRIVGEKTTLLVEERDREVKSLNETISQLVKEKEHIGSLLRSALPKRLAPTSKTKELFQVAENGLREPGIDFQLTNIVSANVGALENDEDELYSLAGALEKIVKASQLQIIELQHSVDEQREESSILKKHVEAQAKELTRNKQRVEELEEKERVANESVEGLMMDITAAEEEITRWKEAAEQEAAAGRAIEHEFMSQLSALRLELEETKQAMKESEKKLKFKEETAVAAMSARDAAEKSLKLADLRASRLRDRLEELTRQLEEFDTREDSRRRDPNRSRYVCWPWQWLGLNFVGHHSLNDSLQQGSNEMELSEPLV